MSDKDEMYRGIDDYQDREAREYFAAIDAKTKPKTKPKESNDE